MAAVAAPSGPQPGSRTHSAWRGERLILLMLLVLAVATIAALLGLAALTAPRFRLRVYIALAGNLWLAGMVAIALSMIGHRRKRAQQGL